DLTDTERVQFGVVSAEPSCPKFDKPSQAILAPPATATPIPTATLPTWTPPPSATDPLEPSSTPGK
ncbi:MAG TPA: hypothetical protein VKQ72_01645, partial [Aggregatilineales bacterium]|nr:hypothetical protein [Aggregatilineales bacterium]